MDIEVTSLQCVTSKNEALDDGGLACTVRSVDQCERPEGDVLQLGKRLEVAKMKGGQHIKTP
jgi:hypothetical protein